MIKYLEFCLQHKKTPRWEGARCVGGMARRPGRPEQDEQVGGRQTSKARRGGSFILSKHSVFRGFQAKEWKQRSQSIGLCPSREDDAARGGLKSGWTQIYLMAEPTGFPNVLDSGVVQSRGHLPILIWVSGRLDVPWVEEEKTVVESEGLKRP